MAIELGIAGREAATLPDVHLVAGDRARASNSCAQPREVAWQRQRRRLAGVE